jgi:hypothetical protein
LVIGIFGTRLAAPELGKSVCAPTLSALLFCCFFWGAAGGCAGGSGSDFQNWKKAPATDTMHVPPITPIASFDPSINPIIVTAAPIADAGSQNSALAAYFSTW